MSMVHPNVHLAIEDDVARIVVDRPERMNACTRRMFESFALAAKEIVAAKARAVVISGAGGNFCSGADVSGKGDPDEQDQSKYHPHFNHLIELPPDFPAGSCQHRAYSPIMARLCA